MHIKNKSTLVTTAVFLLLLVSYELIFGAYFPLPNGLMGHDYTITIGSLLDGYLWFRNNGLFPPPWFSPSFCGGQLFFGDPQSIFYSIPQALSFAFDPVTATHLAFIIFAATGFWGTFIFSKLILKVTPLSSLAISTIFLFNGFYAHRMIIGHYGFQSFMLLPLLAFCFSYQDEKKSGAQSNIFWGLISGILISYCFQSGLATLIPAVGLSVVAVCLVANLYSGTPSVKTLLIRGSLGTILAVGLSLSKLNAGLELMAHFNRDYYLIPGLSSISEIFGLIYQSLFYSSEHVYSYATPLWKNIQWSAAPHELAYGLTPLPFMAIICGGALILISRQESSFSKIEEKPALAVKIILLGIIFLVPILLLFYSPNWNSLLKKIPFINTTTSPFRWISIYIPVVAIFTGIVIENATKARNFLAWMIIIGTPILNTLENREYYQNQSFDPANYVTFYRKIANGEVIPKISNTVDLRTPAGAIAVDNSAFLDGASPMRCYNPVYGYRLEKLVTHPLINGSIYLDTENGGLNLHNPACLIFPEENHCQPWDAFSKEQEAMLQAFSEYKPFPFNKSKRQVIADVISLISLIGTLAYLAWLATSRIFRRQLA